MSAVRGGEAPADLSWLPADLADFVGREQEIERLAALLRPDGAVVVLSGMPGSGKTALASHLARSMPGYTGAEVAFTTGAKLRRHRFDLRRYRAAALLIADGLRSTEIDTLLASADRPPRILVTTRDLGYEPGKYRAIHRKPPGHPAEPDRIGAEPAAGAVRHEPLELPGAEQIGGKPTAAGVIHHELVEQAGGKPAGADVIHHVPSAFPDAEQAGGKPAGAGVIHHEPSAFPDADRVGREPATASVIRLGPLGDEQALRLLGFLAGPERVSREGDAAAEIVRLCGGLPLALRVAGHQLAGRPHTSLREFAEQMRRRRWRGESRQGVVSVIDDARLMLPDAAGRAFALLAVAGETFPTAKWDAIIEVLEVPDRAKLAGALVQAGLLEPQGNTAWRAHPLIVSLAQMHLSRDAGLRAAAAQAMIGWHAQSLDSADLPALLRAVHLAGAWAPRAALDNLVTVADSVLKVLWDKRLWPQWDQVHLAVRSAADRLREPALQTRAAANLVIGYLAQRRYTEADAELRHAAQARPVGYPPEACARLWLHEVTLRWVRGDLDGAQRVAARALAEANQVEDPAMVLLVRMSWAHLERDRGNVGAAVAQWTDIARDAEREALPEVRALALIRAARGSGDLGAVDRARDLLVEAANVSAGAAPPSPGLKPPSPGTTPHSPGITPPSPGTTPHSPEITSHEVIALAELARLELVSGHVERAYAGARRAALLRFGSVEPPETGPDWIWWPRSLFNAIALVAIGVGGLAAVMSATAAPIVVGGLLACVADLLARRAQVIRKRLALNVFRAIQRWLDAPGLAAEVVPLSHLHYDRLTGSL